MSINVKKYTKEQMAKMVEEATERQEAAEAEASAHFKDGVKLAEENEKLRGEIGTLTEQIDQVNGEAINKANEIEKLKADNDFLRGKLNDTETALGRSANETSQLVGDLKDARMQVLDLGTEVDVAHNHPWRNLWAWAKRKFGGERNEHVS